MLRQTRTILPVFALPVFAMVVAGCEPADPSAALDEELAAILGTLPGTYKGEAPIPVPPKGEMKTLYHHFAIIDAPQFGEAVVYYQLSRGSADSPATQMKIFTFNTDPDRTANSMHAHVFAPGQSTGNLDQDPVRLANLDPATLMTFPKECDLVWSSKGDGFIAEVKAEDCGYTSQAFNQIIHPAMSYTLSGDQLVWAEALYRADMSVLFQTPGALPARRIN